MAQRIAELVTAGTDMFPILDLHSDLVAADDERVRATQCDGTVFRSPAALAHRNRNEIRRNGNVIPGTPPLDPMLFPVDLFGSAHSFPPEYHCDAKNFSYRNRLSGKP